MNSMLINNGYLLSFKAIITILNASFQIIDLERRIFFIYDWTYPARTWDMYTQETT